jgi:hypothetical protein
MKTRRHGKLAVGEDVEDSERGAASESVKSSPAIKKGDHGGNHDEISGILKKYGIDMASDVSGELVGFKSAILNMDLDEEKKAALTKEGGEFWEVNSEKLKDAFLQLMDVGNRGSSDVLRQEQEDVEKISDDDFGKMLGLIKIGEKKMDTEKVARIASRILAEVGSVFGFENVEEKIAELKGELEKVCPVVVVRKSSLTSRDLTIMILCSLDPKEKWSNGILENSTYFRMSFNSSGEIEVFGGYGVNKFRRVTVKDFATGKKKIVEYAKSARKSL